MTKVYVVMMHSMMYDNNSSIDRVFSTEAAAIEYVSGIKPTAAYEFEIDEWEVED
jgi:hypothetical protein